MMKSFTQWLEERNSNLAEKTVRAGIAHWAYPDQYIRGHYTDGYFMPRAADAVQKMGHHDPFHQHHKELQQIHPSMKHHTDNPKE